MHGRMSAAWLITGPILNRAVPAQPCGVVGVGCAGFDTGRDGDTAAGSQVDGAAFHPTVFVGIDSDGTVYLVAHRSEMGTSSRTSVPLILADELDADWKRVKLEQAIGDPKYGDQDTDGSHSVRDGFVTMREAGGSGVLESSTRCTFGPIVASSGCEAAILTGVPMRTSA